MQDESRPSVPQQVLPCVQNLQRDLQQPASRQALGDQAQLRRPGLRPLRPPAPGPADAAEGGRPAAGGALRQGARLTPLFVASQHLKVAVKGQMRGKLAFLAVLKIELRGRSGGKKNKRLKACAHFLAVCPETAGSQRGWQDSSVIFKPWRRLQRTQQFGRPAA